MSTSTMLNHCKWLIVCSCALAITSCQLNASDSTEETSSVAQAQTNGDVGFAWISGGTMLANGSFNNHGGTNTVSSLGSDMYQVNFPGLGGSGGNIQVTAIATPPTSHGGAWAWCKTDHFASSGTTLQVFVKCYKAAVFPTASFTVAFQRRTGSVPAAETAYVYADQPTTASYTPNAAYQWSSGGGSVTVTRESTGVYRVAFPGQAATGHRVVESSAVGTDGAYCNPSDGDSNTQARIRCFSSTGTPADSKFMAVFSRKSPNNVASYMYASVPTGSSVSDSYGAVASQCLPDTPISSPATAGPGTGTRVHFPQLSTNFLNYNVSAMAYGNTNAHCQIVSAGAETGGTYAEVACFAATGTGTSTPFVVVFSTTLAIFC